MNRIPFTFLFLILTATAVWSQRLEEKEPLRTDHDTSLRETDTTAYEPDHSPSQAIMFALALPGMGQAYNGKYWKIPLVWAALGGAGYAISFNGRMYRAAIQEFALNTSDDLSERKLKYWRRNLEISYISLVGVYALQVVDAYVDAQLYYWDVNDNLSMRVTPAIQPLVASTGYQGTSYGITWSFILKGK